METHGVQADQAEGLRRAKRHQPVQVVSVLAQDSDVAERLARAMQVQGRRVLLVDTRQRAPGRIHALFDWRQQLARKSVHIGSVNGMDRFHAPAASAGEALIVAAMADYEVLVFDTAAIYPDSVALDIATAQSLIVQVEARAAACGKVYAMLKSLAQNRLAWPMYLGGDAAACARILAAVSRFLQPPSVAPEHLEHLDDAHLAALAARIAAEASGASRADNAIGAQYTHA